MSDGFQARPLGRTGIAVGPLGIGASYGVAAAAIEEAYARGCNYLYWGSARRRRFGKALRILCKKDREGVCFVAQSYTRVPQALGWSVGRALKAVGTDYADVLLLGWHNRPPTDDLVAAALRLKERGVIRFLGLSSHHRPLIGDLAAGQSPFDVLHIRYNAAHRGAETEAFPHCADGGPGIVSFTATRWGTLLRPTQESPTPPSATDCYRFSLSHPAVDVCLTGPANAGQMEAALQTLALGPMSDEELAAIRGHGDSVYARPPKSVGGTLWNRF